ncbi:FecR domain-containing protein [Aureispira sp. CCB-E]|uniref:FecR family protein n=1 Tax=Aureispira sp. CCB-E TaxID=3051121 RepID=UPI002868710A|nr:FecR domain-containing protein [Aureispira sp. CCB-E]WMX16756.1 FecR domain-containing protein [Aureispira sp. CCB-E]
MDSNNNKYLTLLSKVLTKSASLEEKEQLEQWANENDAQKAFVEETLEVWNLSKNYAEDLPVDTNRAWDKLEAKLEVKTPQPTIWRSLASYWKAAVIAGLVATSVFWIASRNAVSVETVLEIVETGEQEQKELILPDGSLVLLNENSSLAYAKDFKVRTVDLKGEAFFDVTKKNGQSFEINTSTTKTKVLGTSFNIRAYDQTPVEVAVVTGKVAVESVQEGNKESVLLLPNETVVYDAAVKKMVKTVEPTNNSVAWKTQELVFDNTELGSVIKTLERYFEVKIEGDPKILNCHYTGTFKEPKLGEVFNTIAFTFPTDLEIKKVDEKYILIGQGCE